MIAHLVEEYESAEALIKSYERHTLASPSVAVNQMRYVGRHLLDYVKAGDAEVVDDVRRVSLEKAVNHCRRAAFDALESLIFSQLEFIADFQDLCRTKRGVENVYPDYVADYSSLVCLQERLQSFKMVQLMSDDERNELEEISKEVSKFKRKILKVKVAVDGLESVEIADEVILSVQQFLLSFATTVLGTIVGIIGIMVGVCSAFRCSWWCKIAGIVAVLAAAGWVWKKFYRWSAQRLLTESQRKQLTERFGIMWH